MKLVTNPNVEAGKKQLSRLREQRFQGYIRSCIEELLASTDAGMYSFAELGTTESEVLNLAIRHVGEDLLSGCQYPFALLKLKNDLVCRKSRCEYRGLPPHEVATPQLVLALSSREAA